VNFAWILEILVNFAKFCLYNGSARSLKYDGAKSFLRRPSESELGSKTNKLRDITCNTDNVAGCIPVPLLNEYHTWHRLEGVVKPCHQFWSELECSFRSPWRLLTESLRKICRRLMGKNTTLFYVPFVMSKSDDIYFTAINNLPTHTVVESGLSE